MGGRGRSYGGGVVRVVTVPNVSDETISRLKQNATPFVFTSEYAELSNELAKYEYIDWDNGGKTVVVDADKAAVVKAKIQKANDEWNSEHSVLDNVKGDLDKDKYYMRVDDYRDRKSTTDIYRLSEIGDDGKFRFVPLGGKQSDYEKLSGKLVAMDEKHAMKRFMQMPGNSGNTFGGISSNEERILRRYTYATPENSSLRKGVITNDAKTVQKVIGRTYNSKSFIVYRGLTGEYADRIVRLKVGESFTDKGFGSSSRDIDVAKSFARSGYILNIKVPKGWGKALSLSYLSMKPEEGEVLLKSGAKYTVRAKKGRNIYVTME